MTVLTRRDALLLTAAVTAASAAEQPAAADNPPAPQPPKEETTILDVPSGVVDGSSIPITIKIPANDIALQKDDSLTNVSITLYLQKDPKDNDTTHTTNNYQAFLATLADTALPSDPKSDIVVMTHLKIGKGPFAAAAPPPPPGTPPSPPTQFTANLFASIDIQYKAAPKKTFTAHQSIAILPQDCAPSSVAVLRFGLQPPRVLKGKAMLVRAILPAAPAIPYPLNKITCTKPDDTDPQKVATPFAMDIMQKNGVYISDEVFISFNLYPKQEGGFVVTMTWDYHDKNEMDATKKIDLIAASYVAIAPPQTQ